MFDCKELNQAAKEQRKRVQMDVLMSVRECYLIGKQVFVKPVHITGFHNWLAKVVPHARECTLRSV